MHPGADPVRSVPPPPELSSIRAAARRVPSDDGQGVDLDLVIPNDVRYIEPVVELIRDECEAFDFPRRHRALNVPVALTEALSNAMLRGNIGRPDADVALHCTVDPTALVVEIRDQGEGFDLLASTGDPTAGAALEREDGRGLFLMRALMDRVERFDDHGNVVRLTLLRP